MPNRPRFVETTRDQASAMGVARHREPVLFVAFHPNLRRVGEWTRLDARITEVSRLRPPLRDASGEDTGPLDDPFLRRHPFELRRLPRGGVEIENPHDVALTVAGRPLAAGAPLRVSTEELAGGVVLVLAERVILMIVADLVYEREELGMRGGSVEMAALRAAVRAAASSPGPILILGETGSGKELVARALHATGPRAAGPFIAVNVAAIPASVAAAELFGHERGAFTGADAPRPGYFARAAGGVLFLDEIADLPSEVQPILLRALESGEVQPVGGLPRRLDVTVVAATDAALDDAAAARGFRRPLYYRCARAAPTSPRCSRSF
jgi:predicted ATP-dependent protease